MELKRYDIEYDPHEEYILRESPNGGWIRFKDLVAFLAGMDMTIEDLD